MFLLIFVPVIVFATAFMALLLGAAAGSVWEAIEERPQESPPAAGPVLTQVAPTQPSHARAA